MMDKMKEQSTLENYKVVLMSIFSFILGMMAIILANGLR